MTKTREFGLAVADCLDGAREKLRRALSHSKDLTDRIYKRARNDLSDSISIGKHYDAAQKCFIFVAEKYTLPDAPDDWSLILGDAIHNARSALDYLAWQIVRLGAGPHPPKSPTSVQFPIVSRLKPGQTAVQAFDSEAGKRLPGADNMHLSVVQRYQPVIGFPHDPMSHPFAMLNMLSNHDKHRSLRLVESFLYDFWAEMIDATNFDNPGVIPRHVTDLDPGTELFRVCGEPTGKGEPDVRVEFKAVGVIVIARDADLPDMPFVGLESALGVITKMVGDLLDEFDRIL